MGLGGFNGWGDFKRCWGDFEDEKMKGLMLVLRQNLTFYTILSPHLTKKV